MKRATAVLAAWLATAAAIRAQDLPFESSEYGVRLKIPAGWNVDATRQPQVILKLNHSGDHLFKPELQVYEVRLGEPTTIGQHKEVVRQYIQRAYREPKILEERAGSAGGRAGFLLVVASKTINEAEAVSWKLLVEVSPRRLLGVDGVFPKGKEEELGKAFDRLVGSIDFIPRRSAPADLMLKAMGEAAKKLAAAETPAEREDELGIYVGDRQVGTYKVRFRPAARGAAKGLEVETWTSLDLGEEKVETRIAGFLSNDMSLQAVELEESKLGKDKRMQYFAARSTLDKGEISVERRINGERSSLKFKAPERFLFAELGETLQYRLLRLEKTTVATSTLSAFENDFGSIAIEVGGKHKMKTGQELVDIYVAFLRREDGTLVTYWYDSNFGLNRLGASGQALVIKK
jgi:hypothetical protein